MGKYARLLYKLDLQSLLNRNFPNTMSFEDREINW